jgi:hypothetical protein
MTQHTLSIPDRQSNALTGSRFIDSIRNIKFDPNKDEKRENAYLEQFIAGNIPEFMRSLVPVDISDGTVKAVIYVMPEYLCIGSDDDYVIVPMNPLTAQRIMDAWGGQLPTRKIVDTIYKASAIKMNFHPMTPPRYPYDHSMMHTDRYETAGAIAGQLIAGHKKDVIIDTWLESAHVNFKKVGVYGGWLGGKILHNFRTHSHDVYYKDYSHGIRCVSQLVYYGPNNAGVSEHILRDPKKHKLLSNQPTAFKTARYPVA